MKTHTNHPEVLTANDSISLLHRERRPETDLSPFALVVPILAAVIEISAAVWLLGLIFHSTPNTTPVAESTRPASEMNITLAASHR